MSLCLMNESIPFILIKWSHARKSRHVIKYLKFFLWNLRTHREWDECASVFALPPPPPFDCAVLCSCICCSGLNRSFLMFALLLVISLLLLIVVVVVPNASPLLFDVVVLK